MCAFDVRRALLALQVWCHQLPPPTPETIDLLAGSPSSDDQVTEFHPPLPQLPNLRAAIDFHSVGSNVPHIMNVFMRHIGISSRDALRRGWESWVGHSSLVRVDGSTAAAASTAATAASAVASAPTPSCSSTTAAANREAKRVATHAAAHVTDLVAASAEGMACVDLNDGVDWSTALHAYPYVVAQRLPSHLVGSTFGARPLSLRAWLWPIVTSATVWHLTDNAHKVWGRAVNIQGSRFAMRDPRTGLPMHVEVWIGDRKCGGVNVVSNTHLCCGLDSKMPSGTYPVVVKVGLRGCATVAVPLVSLRFLFLVLCCSVYRMGTSPSCLCFYAMSPLVICPPPPPPPAGVTWHHITSHHRP